MLVLKPERLLIPKELSRDVELIMKKQAKKAKKSVKTKSTKNVKRVSTKAVKRARRRSSPIDIQTAQAAVLDHLSDCEGTDSTPNLADIGHILGFRGSPSNIYQRVLRIVGPIRGKTIGWGRGRGKGVYLLKANGANGSKGPNGANGNIGLS